MKKVTLLLLSIVFVFGLTSCISIDTWALPNEEKEELIDSFKEYVLKDEYSGYTYASDFFDCLNCSIGDGYVESWGDIIEIRDDTVVYRSDEEYILIHQSTYQNEYFVNDTYYIELGDSIYPMEVDSAELQLESRHLYLLNILKTIFEEENYDSYVKKVSASEDFALWVTISFTFDVDQLVEDHVIDEGTAIVLRLGYGIDEEQSLERVLMEMSFILDDGITRQSLELIKPNLQIIKDQDLIPIITSGGEEQ